MDVDAVARAAAQDAGGLDPGLLGDFLPTVVQAARTGRRLRRQELERCSACGATAARQGVALRALVDLYLSACWRLWAELDVDAAEPSASPARERAGATPGAASAARVKAAALAMLRAADDGVAALAEGFQLARSELVRRQEVERREVFEALLAGGRAAEQAFGQAAALGLHPAGPHAVLVAGGVAALQTGAAAAVLGRVERALTGRYGDASPLVSVRDGQLVCVVAAPDAAAVQQVTERVTGVLQAEQSAPAGWQVAVGGAGLGPAAIRLSYEQARDALHLAGQLGLTSAVVLPTDLAVYRVLLRDQAAMRDLIEATLLPLAGVRGGPVLLDTLYTFLDSGAVVAEAARRLHLSVRAVSYRLQRVRSVLQLDPADPAQRLALHAAVVGARLLRWPDEPLVH